MSNLWAIDAWESVPQVILNGYCVADGLPKRARHKWVHIVQAVRLTGMSPLEIYKEGHRDFLALRTNSWHYLDEVHHVDGILHPDPVVERIGKVAFQNLGNRLWKELQASGLPSELDLALMALVFDDPEVMHKMVRKVEPDIKKRRGGGIANRLNENSFTGQQLRQMGIWQDYEQMSPKELVERLKMEGKKLAP